MGHSTGLLLVGLVLIVRDSTRDENDSDVIDVPDALSHFFESLVGFFMIFLGMYGFRRALRKKHEIEGRVEIGCCDIDLDPVSSIQIMEEDCGFQDEQAYHDIPCRKEDPAHHVGAAKERSSDEPSSRSPSSLNLEDAQASNGGRPPSSTCMGQWMESSRQLSVQTIAVLIGIIHGLAGPAGVLAVIPAVQLHDWVLATLYLSSFCVSSTLTMGCFAGFYGSCSKGVGRRTQLEFQIHLFSASLSVLVGVTWLVLLALGKLEDVFP